MIASSKSKRISTRQPPEPASLRTWLRCAVVAWLVAGCGDDDSQESAPIDSGPGGPVVVGEPPPEPGALLLGEPCTRSSECMYLACIKVGEDRSVCSHGCTDDGNCPVSPSWSCVLPPQLSVRVCACESTDEDEICGDGLDNDCDGVTDCPPAAGEGGAGATDAGTRDAGGCPGGDCDAGPPSCATDPGLCPACTASAECDDRIACTEDHCRARGCVHVPKDSLCASAEICDPRMDGCTDARACARDADCTDEDACTQAERCDMSAAVCRFNLLDQDADEHLPAVCGGDDCDDSNSDTYPGALDVCDGVDNDCNNSVDPASAALLCADDRVCAAGTCACGTGRTECRGRCFATEALLTDVANCGTCGNDCGVGMTCEEGVCHDIDECMADPDPCGANSTCTNSTHSFSCPCNMGYMLSVGQCVDVDECTANTDNCDSSPNACVNSVGTFGCACPEGYSGDGVGTNGCTDIDECAANTDDCNATTTACVNSTASFWCTRRAIAVAAGSYHTCALLHDGSVKCWGENYVGQLGQGDMLQRGDGVVAIGDQLPTVSLGSGRTAKAISAGAEFTCALLDNDSVKCWGGNASGQLGIGSVLARGDAADEMGDALPPVDLGSGRTAKAISAGGTHACALLDDNTIKCWGANLNGQLGQGNMTTRGDVPGNLGDTLLAVDLGTGHTAKAVDAGAAHTCALLNDDTVKCWGLNLYGRLGLGTTDSRGDGASEMGDLLPTVMLGTERTAKAVVAADGHTCALLDDDTVKCWGYNVGGRLGLGSTTHRGDAANEMGDFLPAVLLGTGLTAKAIVAGRGHTCAVLNTDALKCWGEASYGQLGLGNINARGDGANEMGDNLPVIDLGSGRNAAAVVLGMDHSCALLDDDTLKCWGYNGNGELGQGDTLPRGDNGGEMGNNLPPIDLGSQ